ncbi:TIGR02234 family membrane protein [Corynebacterium alimapuense]|uniref:TIGR02234 family membrane protein n=1 Tax=Corynebacterium alimapuense TaxID=1576874 RepID=A0A3M8KAG3_9CORY|nr:TIGR02234 family membrane protein [Corynebacterium alimapuense]RNE49448.1 TIGR02234 family membrane protein [Corynebacterium alimapuense]
MKKKATTRTAALLIGLGAIVLWAGSRFTWITVETFDDKSGEATLGIPGATWSTESTAVSLLLLAACVAGFALRRTGRRFVGIIAALAAVGASWGPLNLLAGEPSQERARSLLASGAASQRADTAVLISEWAEVIALTVSPVGVIISMIGCAIALFGGVLLAVRPGQDSPKLNKYERRRDREARILDDLEATPDSGRVMWDALDADIDPTDADTRG